MFFSLTLTSRHGWHFMLIFGLMVVHGNKPRIHRTLHHILHDIQPMFDYVEQWRGQYFENGPTRATPCRMCLLVFSDFLGLWYNTTL